MGVDISFDEQVLFIQNCGTLGIPPRKLLGGFIQKINKECEIMAKKGNSQN